MARLTGTFKIRAGSENPQIVQIVNSVDEEPEDLTGAISASWMFINTTTEAVTEFTTADKLAFVSPRTEGKLQLNQLRADFPDEAEYDTYIKFVDSANKQHFVPDDDTFECFLVGPAPTPTP